MDEITIGLVSYFSTQHLVNLLPNLRNTAVNSKLKIIVCDNTNREDEDLYQTFEQECEIFPYAPVNPRKRRREKASGSFAHAAGLNYLLTKVETEYSLFLDPDCLVLTKGWDIICKTYLAGSTIAVGLPYHSRKIIKYNDFPSPIFIFFNPTQFRNIKADWSPYTDSFLIYMCDQLLRVLAITGARFGEAINGDKFYASKVASWMRMLFGGSSKDTGWRIPFLARRNGYSSVLFPPVTAPHQLAPLVADNPEVLVLMRKFELFTFQGIPFVTHFHGTRHSSEKDMQYILKQWRELAISVRNACENILLDSYL